MLIIRKKQMAAFEDQALARFERLALAHLTTCLPEDCSEMGPDDLTATVRSGIQRALKYGFESELDVLRFLNLMFLLDFNFDRNPEFAWTADFLYDAGTSPSARMDSLYETAEEILARDDEENSADDGQEP